MSPPTAPEYRLEKVFRPQLRMGGNQRKSGSTPELRSQKGQAREARAARVCRADYGTGESSRERERERE